MLKLSLHYQDVTSEKARLKSQVFRDRLKIPSEGAGHISCGRPFQRSHIRPKTRLGSSPAKWQGLFQVKQPFCELLYCFFLKKITLLVHEGEIQTDCWVTWAHTGPIKMLHNWERL